MTLLARHARRQQAISEVVRLRDELETWFADWTAADRHADGSQRGQYTTQLASIYEEVNGTAEILHDNLRNLAISGDAGELYGRCALIERQIIWLWRVFYFFRDKFDQRHDDRFANVLAAADEVVWSCFRPFFQAPNPPQPLQPAPLPYIELDFSPSSLRREQKEVLGRRDADFLLVKAAFPQLPTSIVRLPITALNSPWALVLVGHEVGHVVQSSVADKFPSTFQKTIRDTVYAANNRDDDADVWSGWADEIFADLYAILTMGQWAVWAMAQFETAEPAAMSERRFVYPSPTVRLSLMASLAQQFGLEQEAYSAPATPPDELARDLAYVPAVVAAIGGLADVGRLVQALPFAASVYGSKARSGSAGQVEQWCQHLLGSGAEPTTNKPSSARLVTAGGAMAWSSTVFTDDEPTVDGVDSLREVILQKITASAAPGTRSVAGGAAREPEPGRRLFDVLNRVDVLLEAQN